MWNPEDHFIFPKSGQAMQTNNVIYSLTHAVTLQSSDFIIEACNWMHLQCANASISSYCVIWFSKIADSLRFPVRSQPANKCVDNQLHLTFVWRVFRVHSSWHSRKIMPMKHPATDDFLCVNFPITVHIACARLTTPCIGNRINGIPCAPDKLIIFGWRSECVCVCVCAMWCRIAVRSNHNRTSRPNCEWFWSK